MSRFPIPPKDAPPLTDEDVAQKLSGTEHSLKDEWSVMAALVETGVRPWIWDGHKGEVAKRALEIRAERAAAERKARLRDRRATVLVSCAIGAATLYVLAPVEAFALPLPEWAHQPVLSPASGLLGFLGALVAGAVIWLLWRDPKPLSDRAWNDNASPEQRAREWKGHVDG